MSMTHRMGALIVANFIAAAAVGGMSLLATWIVAIASPGDAGLSSAIGWAFTWGLIAAGVGFVVSFPFYLVGLTFVGIPTWWALHKTQGERSRVPDCGGSSKCSCRRDRLSPSCSGHRTCRTPARHPRRAGRANALAIWLQAHQAAACSAFLSVLARTFSLSDFSWPQAARMSRPRGVRMGLA